jgi:LAO/AO transport system kinase
MDLIKDTLAGNVRAAARLMSLIENHETAAIEALKGLFPNTGRAYVIGITGPPGSGKSTLVDRITSQLRAQQKTVGIIAVDPSSPFSGGAILGDRIRMQRHGTDEGVFIRSMATRGQMGGLARSTHDVVYIMDALGKDYILVETVGVGQDEVEIVKTAHTTVVVGVPGSGDEIQALKAGVMEIGDIFAINKADREGAERAMREIEIMLEQREWPAWKPQVYKTIAKEGAGIEALTAGILEHERFIKEHEIKDSLEKQRSQSILRELLQETCTQRILERLSQNGSFEELVNKVTKKELDPYTAVDEILKKVGL